VTADLRHARAPEAGSHDRRLASGDAIRYWRLSPLFESRYDVPDRPMQGKMDAFFFVAKHKNFIPHEYPCRTDFARDRRGRRPDPLVDFSATRLWLPFGSDRVDLSGFWFRPTRVAAWAQTCLSAEAAGEARLKLVTCGGAILFAGGEERLWMAGYNRNLEETAEISVPLAAGLNEIRVYFDDLAERDARYFFQLDYVDGPPAAVVLPGVGRQAASLEWLLEGMRFDRPSYLDGDITIVLPEAAPADMSARIEILGDFMSTERIECRIALAAGETRLPLGPSADLPADFRHFNVTLDLGGVAASRMIGVEICHVGRQGVAPADRHSRIAEALDEVAEFSERDSVRALARLALGRGGADTDAMIAETLPAIEDVHDCADFLLVPLLWCRIAWGHAIARPTRDRIDRAILDYRYWLDEPGNDVQWYFSENHALLFHAACYLAGTLRPEAIFRRSGRTGRDQADVGRRRVIEWLDHFEAWEMAEWNSAPYFPIDLKGLTALYALAPDAEIRMRAGKGILRLLEIVACSSHHGMITASQGRSYEHTLRPGRSLELSGVARLLWGRGWYGRRFHALPQLAVCLRDHGLEVPLELADIALYRGVDGQEWRFTQGENRFAALYHYKTRDFAMGSLAAYRWAQWGYQETVLHLRLGETPEAQIWINHPGETIQSGYGRPSYWGGCGTLPRVHQYRALAVVDFDCHAGQPDFTHAWLPAAELDEVRIRGDRILARSGNGLALIVGSDTFVPITAGPTADAEVRLPGRRGRWIVRLSDVENEGSLAGLDQRLSSLSVSTADEGDLVVVDPDYGRVVFRATGEVDAEGRRLDPRTWTTKGERTQLIRRAASVTPI
jgi:hypothetical protein